MSPTPRAPRIAKGLLRGADDTTRCWWCGDDPLYTAYHDDEWGLPVDDDTRLFEKICLEGFQAGLAWITILRKRAAFRKAFRGFDPELVARFDRRSVERLLRDAAIVRHRGKIESAISNAKCALALRDEAGSLARFFWRFEPAPATRPRKLTHAAMRALTESDESRALSRELKARGFRFVGPTTMYALMQSTGIVNDHLEGCAARASVETARERFRRP